MMQKTLKTTPEVESRRQSFACLVQARSLTTKQRSSLRW
jgi:hypothetical protein